MVRRTDITAPIKRARLVSPEDTDDPELVPSGDSAGRGDGVSTDILQVYPAVIFTGIGNRRIFERYQTTWALRTQPGVEAIALAMG